jgi:hypothetical protein
LLHGKDLVFGDLREANVLYSPKDKGRLFLVDYDGTGEHGKDRYSPCLNTDLGLGADRRQVMERSRDKVQSLRVHFMAFLDGQPYWCITSVAPLPISL